PSTPAVPLSAASVQDPKNGQKTAGVTVMSDIPENLTHAQGTFKAVYYGATFAQLGYIGGDAAIQIGEESAPCFKGRGGIGDTCLGRERTKLVYKFAKAQNGNTMLVPVSRKDDKVERLSRVDPSRVPVNQVEASRMIGEEMKRKILGLAKALKAAKSTGGAKPSDPGFRKCEKALRDYGIKKNFEFLQDKAYLQSLADLDLEFPLVEAKMIETPAAR
nr:hypothetical protein [Bdellovibrionales bacterium]